MSMKSPKTTKEQSAQFKLPSIQEIETLLKIELERWKTNAENGPYPIPVLDFLISKIGCDIELAKDIEEFGKDEKHGTPSACVNGITNGEYLYSLYHTILKFTKEESFELQDLAFCDQQILASLVDSATELFLDTRDPADPDQGWVDLWIIYTWCRRKSEMPVWTSEDDEPAEAPELHQLSEADWEYIAESVKEHFVLDEDIYYTDLVLEDEQPHWPTHQEFRRATAWIMEWHGSTRWNRPR